MVTLIVIGVVLVALLVWGALVQSRRSGGVPPDESNRDSGFRHYLCLSAPGVRPTPVTA